MPDDDVVLRSARNAYLLVLLLLLGISTYQFTMASGVSGPVAVMWVACVVGFYGSKYYYKHTESGAD